MTYNFKGSISIHAPAKGATFFGTCSNSHLPNFNPRSREGSDAEISSFRVGLVDFNPRSREGSDAAKCTDNQQCDISIHAPAKGATRSPAAHPQTLRDFNPRSREGSDRSASYTFRASSNFNPRSREGSDPGALTDSTDQPLFQSTLPRRERQLPVASLRRQ